MKDLDLMPLTTSLKSSFLYSTVHLLYCRWWWWWWGGGGGGRLLFFRTRVKGVIEFFCDARGGAGHFV